MWVRPYHGRRPSIEHMMNACIWRELREQYIVAHNGTPPWSTKAFFHTVRDIQHLDVHSSGIFTEDFRDQHPQDWTKMALNTLEEAKEAYMVEVIADSHF